MRLIHCSDLHFFSPSFSKELLSKQSFSILFHLLARSNKLSDDDLYKVISVWKEQKADLILISGDCTTLSSKKEYLRAKKFFTALQSVNLPYIVIPGNHDAFIQKAVYENRFYNLDIPHKEELSSDRFFLKPLCKDWHILGFDCAIPTPFFRAYGKIESSVLQSLEKKLATLPDGEKVMIVNHFPLIKENGKPSIFLKGSSDFCSLLSRFDRLHFVYLTGHTHVQKIDDGRELKLPIQINSGSLRFKPSPSWNLLCLSDSLAVDLWGYEQKEWKVNKSYLFEWSYV